MSNVHGKKQYNYWHHQLISLLILLAENLIGQYTIHGLTTIKGQFQETHDHLQYDFSCVFFPTVKENFSQFYFYNRYANSVSKSWFNLLNIPSSWNPAIESGDIIFFPGSMLHAVSPHKSDEVRKTLSCNFDFDLSR